MAARRVPMGGRISIGLAIFVLTFFLMRPSDPATRGQIYFWKKAAGLVGEPDVEGFVGIALLIVCSMVTIVGYQIAVRLIEKKLNK